MLSSQPTDFAVEVVNGKGNPGSPPFLKLCLCNILTVLRSSYFFREAEGLEGSIVLLLLLCALLQPPTTPVAAAAADQHQHGHRHARLHHRGQRLRHRLPSARRRRLRRRDGPGPGGPARKGLRHQWPVRHAAPGASRRLGRPSAAPPLAFSP